MTLSTNHQHSTDGIRDWLEPVRAALIEDAAAEGKAILAEACQRADSALADAEESVNAQLAEARRRREATAGAHASLVLSHARNTARRQVMQAREASRQQLREELHAAARSMRTDPRYRPLLDRLEGLAQSQLGPDVVIERDPEPDGGIIASLGNRRVDYTLPALADRALDGLSEEAAALWS